MKIRLLSKFLFYGILAGIVTFCVFYSLTNINPIVTSEYILSCIEGEEQRNLLLNIARLEGRIEIIQKMIPIYASLLIAIVLFLTWTQSGIAKSTAINEINDNFKSYKDRIEELLIQANELTEGIRTKYEAISELTDAKFDIWDLSNTIKNKKDGTTN